MAVKDILGSGAKLKAEKLSKQVVLYFPAKVIVEKSGAHCGKCMMFFKDRGEGRCTVVEGKIDGPNGVCGLYVHGKHSGPTMDGMIDKSVVGYIEDGPPTQCGNCEYYVGGPTIGICKKVEGRIEFYGCCNAWEAREVVEDFEAHEMSETPEEEYAEHEYGDEESEE